MTSDIGLTPATEPEDLDVAPPQSSWPRVIGVIAIVLGCLGTLCSIAGVIMSQFQESMLKMAQNSGNAGMSSEAIDAQIEVYGKYSISVNALAVVGTFVAIWLLVNGIAILQRKSWARASTMGWSITKLMTSLLAVGLNVMIALEIAQVLDDLGETQQAQFQRVGMWIQAIILLWLWALPVFLLIWLSRGKIKDEMATWNEVDRSLV